jgi:hypothetical protein
MREKMAALRFLAFWGIIAFAGKMNITLREALGR